MAELGGGPAPPPRPTPGPAPNNYGPPPGQGGFGGGPPSGGPQFGGAGLGFDDGRSRGGPAGGSRGRPGDELPDDCKLYIGNLSPIITDQVLRQMMEPFGNVLHAVVLLDMPAGTSRGFGFVHMDNADSAGGA
jgi:hypothetical protein